MSSATVYAGGGEDSYAGGVAGQITAQESTGSPCLVTRSCATGDVMAEGGKMQNNAGGIAGQIFRGTVSACWASGNISAAGSPVYLSAVGGLVGGCYEEGIIENCFSTGLVSATDDFTFSYGGFVGRLGGLVTNSYSTGRVEITTSNGNVYSDNVIVGSGRSDGHVVSCFDLMDNTRGYPIYVNQEQGQQDVMERISITEAKNRRIYTDKGWDFDEIWKISGNGYSLPVLKGVHEEIQARLSMPKHLSS